jgi:CheY-like chemotaxis protein
VHENRGERERDPSPDHDRERVVLLVEDDVLVRFISADILRDGGYEVVEAANGEEAMQCLASGLRIDIIVTDIRMPGAIDGLKLVELVAQDFPHLPVLVISSHLPRSGTAPSGYLAKPFSSEALLGKVRALEAGHAH